MKFAFCTLLLISFILSITGCSKSQSPCDCGDPIPSQFFIAKITDQQGKNLVFGAAALYNPDSIQILKQQYPPLSNGFVQKDPRDSVLHFDLIQPISKNYIYYNSQTSRDSIEIKWITKTRTCCGSTYNYYYVDSIKFNNTNINRINAVFIFRK